MRLWIIYLLAGASVFILSYQYNKRFLDWLRFQSLGTRDYVAERLSLMFYDIPPQKILVYMTIISVGPAFIVFLIMVPNWIAAAIFSLIVAVVGWKAPKPIVEYVYQRRVKKFVSQMVDGLSLMSNGMKSGLSVVQALGVVTQEMQDPIRQEFNLVLSENKLGVSIEEAFNNLAKRIQADDVEMFVTSVNILKETGGNLAETFDTIVTTIRERVKVENKIAAVTASGLYQGVVLLAIIPILGVSFYSSDAEATDLLFNTFGGIALLLTIITIEIVAMIVILKIMKIDV